jgi:PAS domain S-box-containing protein
MNWAVAGSVYAGLYVGLVLALGENYHARLLVGNAALLIPPIVPLAVMYSRRGQWKGRQAVFWAAIAAWPALWLAGQVGWSIDEVLRGVPLPWFKWPIVLQLCGSALPLIALVAWPHRGSHPETAGTAAIDVAVLAFLTGFLYWSLIIAPGTDPVRAPTALRALATIGPLVRLAAVAGLLWATWRAGKSAWATVYTRLAMGLAFAFVVLVGLSMLTLSGDYQTGSPADVGWMLPFWFAAWAMATAPASQPELSRGIAGSTAQHASPALLFFAIIAVPIVGYGSRYVVPASPSIEHMREIATAATLVGGVALVMVRLHVERSAVDEADERVRLLAAACEQAGELIIITGQNRIEYANDAFCQLTGYSRQELGTLTPIELVAPESKAEVPALREQLRAHRVVRAATVMLRKDGGTFKAAWSAASIVNAAGRVTHVVAVIRDQTEELLMREHLVRGERLAAIGELVSGVAHEVNNPLQSVIGTIELLLGEQHDARVRDDLERARYEAGRAGRIVRNLLAFVRRSPAERLLSDINEIVQSTVSVRAYELGQANVQLREEYGPNMPVVLANRDEIQQVILNLVINAQHAMVDANGGGVMTVRTFTHGDRAVIEVADDGPGIASEYAGRVFEPFFTTKVVGAGTGLGLSLSFGIAQAHGGSLELMPADRGACFRLTLPSAGFPGPVVGH